MRPLLVLGLDGLDPTLLAALSDEIDLPHLAPLLDGSQAQRLTPGEERYSGLAWEQFSSGRDVASGGRTSAVDFDPRTYTATQPPTRLEPFTASLDARVVALDVPYFSLATGNAQGLASWGAHDPGVPRHARPASLDDELRSRFGDYPATPWIYGFVWPDVEAAQRMGADLVRAIEVRCELTTWLLTERMPGWDLALTVVAELHSASEALWHGYDEGHPLHGHASAAVARKALQAIYAAVDRLVGRIVDACPHADVVAFTPHGMGRNTADVPAMLLLPELLYRRETGKRSFEAPPGWQRGGRGPAVWPAETDWSQLVLGAMAAPRDARADRRRRKQRAEADGSERGFPLAWMPAARYRTAWPAMRMFALPSFYDSRVRVNRKGREAAGQVARRKEGAVVDGLRKLLAETVDLETGAAVDVDISSRSDGSLPDAVAAHSDVVVRWNRSTTGVHHPVLGTIGPTPWRRTGGHTGGNGCIATLGRTALALPGDLGSPATVAQWIRSRFA